MHVLCQQNSYYVDVCTHNGGLNLKIGNMIILLNNATPRKIQASFTAEN